ncbi:peptidase MA family metallohydrolase [Myxococcus sp. Y35]|uniref:peptidase MA family metallohydrolase n=1 Tax=Pseudomyxococcus flavus TaxID=3115648 RepID=UPI003CEDBA45
MRHLLVLLLLLATPGARAQGPGGTPGPHGHDVVYDAALVPLTRPAEVSGEVTTKRFRILHTAAATAAAHELARQIEGVRDAFGSILGKDWPGVTEIRLGVGRSEFEALALPGGKPPGWAVALAYPAHQIILLDALSLHAPDGQQTLRHELAHVALGQLAPEWPRWFQEGVAQNVTGEHFSITHYAALFRAVTQERVFHFEHLARAWPDVPSDVEIAYAQSAAFVAHLSSKFGPQGMAALVDGVARGEPFETAFGKAFRTSLLVEETAWRDGLAARYGWLPLTTSSALVWLGASFLCVAAYARRRQQRAARLAEMAAQDAAEDATLRLLAAQAAAANAQAPLASAADATWPDWPSGPPGTESHAPPPDTDAVLADGASPDFPGDADDEDGPHGRPPKPTLH